jgi:hypothetical protein
MRKAGWTRQLLRELVIWWWWVVGNLSGPSVCMSVEPSMPSTPAPPAAAAPSEASSSKDIIPWISISRSKLYFGSERSMSLMFFFDFCQSAEWVRVGVRMILYV